MSWPDPLTEKTPPAATLALPASPTDPMSVSFHGDPSADAATEPDIHSNRGHIVPKRTDKSRKNAPVLHSLILHTSPHRKIATASESGLNKVDPGAKVNDKASDFRRRRIAGQHELLLVFQGRSLDILLWGQARSITGPTEAHCRVNRQCLL